MFLDQLHVVNYIANCLSSHVKEGDEGGVSRMKTFFLAVAILYQLLPTTWSVKYLEIPDEPKSTRRDALCAGPSRHGAPCTT